MNTTIPLPVLPGAAEAVVHLGAIVAPQARIPVGWVAVGDPARVYPPGEAEAIAAGLAEAGWSRLPFIFGVDDAGGRRDQLRAALARYTTAMVCHHRQNQILGKGRQSWLERQYPSLSTGPENRTRWWHPVIRGGRT